MINNRRFRFAKKLYILISILVIGFNFCLAQQEVPIKVDRLSIADSISKEILNTPDSLMDALFIKIKRNRKKLKADYLPLLYEYANKSEAINYQKGKMQVYDRIGLQYRFNEQYDSALYFHNLSLNLALKLTDSVQLYYNYNNIGQVYRQQNLNVLAINSLHKALKITEDLGDKKAISFTQNTLGSAYVAQKDYDKAMQYFRRSIALGKISKDKGTLAYNYSTMGEVFLLQNQIDSALLYLNLGKILKTELGNRRGIPISDHLTGQAYYVRGDMINSEKYFNLALSGHINNKNKRYQSFCYAYLGMINIKKNKLNKAESFLKEGEEIAKSIHSMECLILIYDAYFDLYKKTGQWEKAIMSLQLSNNYEDSIINIINGQQLQLLEVEYETHKKEQQIEILNSENKIKNQRIRLGLAIISTLLLLVIMIFFLMRMRKKNAQMAQDDLKQKLFRSQMNPHFIYNALGSIQNYMYKNETKKAAQFLGNFASLSRSILKYSNEESISLDEEIRTLSNYLELEQMRMNNAFKYEFLYDQNLETEFINIPPIMIQPFVENSIKHGFNEMETNGILSIQICEKDDFLEVIVVDNGIGIKKSQQMGDKQHESMATQIFNERMKHIKKKNKQIPDVSIEDISDNENSGTKIHLFLPILK